MISAVYSRFSGVLRGGSVWRRRHTSDVNTTWSHHRGGKGHWMQRRAFYCDVNGFWPHQKEVVVFRFRPQILEDDLLHEALHQVPVLHYPVTDGPLQGEEDNVSFLDSTDLTRWRLTSCLPLLHTMVCLWLRPRWRSPGHRPPSSSGAGPGLPPWPTLWSRYLETMKQDAKTDEWREINHAWRTVFSCGIIHSLVFTVTIHNSEIKD